MLELQDLRDFSIQTWYDKFKEISLRTIIFELPKVLIEKLQSDDSDFKIEDICSRDFVTSLTNALSSLDRNVFIKNNWHAPMDAKVFSFGNQLKVVNLSDIILYFTTSTVILEDFSTQSDIPFVIALRPWLNIHPASEFRCIIINNVLRGITPRDWPTYYPHFKDEGPGIVELLREFFEKNIKLKFPRKHFTFDVVISYSNKPLILDFGPLTSKTCLYAFSWKEIFPLLNKEENTEEFPPIFRYLKSDIGIVKKTYTSRQIGNCFEA